jgi:phosphatidylserine/phosphatidylglycerophosphate/cardiolipin synthase-like enzyme
MTKFTNYPDVPNSKINPAPPSDFLPAFKEATQKEVLWSRQVQSSLTYNLVRPPPIISVDWFMEPEIPHPEGTFLQWPTRRVFFEDKLQVRIQILGMLISGRAKVEILLREWKITGDNDLMLVTNDGESYKKASIASSLRFLKQGKNIGIIPQDNTERDIFYETDEKDHATFFVTTIALPKVENPGDGVYYVTVIVKDLGWLLEDISPPLAVIPWWANPSENRSYPKVNAKEVQPLVDGESYFGAIAKAIENAGKYIYIASWKMWWKVHLTGEPGGGGKTLDQLLLEAANRGVSVYIMVDYHNGEWVAPLLNAFLKHPRIQVKSSMHPSRFFKYIASYHEKYCCMDGEVAFVGGIDLEPDKYSPSGHAWKSDWSKFEREAAAVSPHVRAMYERVYEDYKISGFLLWHDIGVRLKGDPVKVVEHEFVERWNLAAPTDNVSNTLAENALKVTSGGTIQIVKTHRSYLDSSVGSLGKLTSDQGTLNVFTHAIKEARHYIYIENQYVNYPPLGDLLVEALNSNVHLQLLVVIPFVTEEGLELGATRFRNIYFPMGLDDIVQRGWAHGEYNQAQILKKLRAINNAADRVGIFGLAGCTSAGTPEQIYPHAKTMVVDDVWAYIGSANANGRGFVSDDEIGVVIHDRQVVQAYRKALWKEHLSIDIETRDIREFCKAWNAKALDGKAAPSDCTCGELRSVHAVKYLTPPAGQKYEGPLEYDPYLSWDDLV